MQSCSRRAASTLASVALLLGAAACGGGNDGAATDQLAASATGSDRATALARPRPPPAPTTDSTLALASANAAGQAAEGRVCGVSADGGKLLFTSSADTVVSTGNTPFADDIFLKNLNGNGVTRAVNSNARNLKCLGMTPDANTVVYTADASDGQVDVLGNSGTETAIFVQNQITGQQTRVTPFLSTLPNAFAYQFAGVSDDGLRVAFVAQPTLVCFSSGYDCTPSRPARVLVRDLASGTLINLEGQLRFNTAQADAASTVWLAPNGRLLAFASQAAYPEAGSPNGGVFVFNINNGTVRLVNADAAGRQVQLGNVRAFLSNSSKVAFFNSTATNAGPAGVYVKDLTSGSLTRSPANLTPLASSDSRLSFSDDGRRVTYVESNGLGGQFFNSLPRVVDLTTGAILNAATLTNGTVGNGIVTVSALLSRDGRVAAFDNNATNLLGARLPGGGAEQRAYRKLLP
jgi:hypothetical protein